MKFLCFIAFVVAVLASPVAWGQCANLRFDPESPVEAGSETDLRFDPVAGADAYRLEILDPLTNIRSTRSLISTANSVHLFVPRTLRDVSWEYRLVAMSSNTVICTETISLMVEADDELREELIRAVVPVAGSLPGAFGSNWRTIMSLANDHDETIEGTIRFLPAGDAISDELPSLAYELEPGESVQYPNVVEALGATGLGSLDVIPIPRFVDAESVVFPVIQVRIVNDADEDTTYGTPVYPVFPTAIAPHTVGDELDVPAQLIDPVAHGVISSFVVPPDYGSARVNVGMRSFNIRHLYYSRPGDPASAFVAFSLMRNGEEIEQVAVPLPDRYMQQVAIDEILTTALLPGDVIMTRGVATLVYWSITDNETNDPSFFLDITSLNGQMVTPELP